MQSLHDRRTGSKRKSGNGKPFQPFSKKRWRKRKCLAAKENIIKVINMGKKKKNIGIEAKQPKESCSDVKCPWHGHTKIRGRIFQGTVVSAKGSNTAIVEWNYYNMVPKYERYERRKTKIAVHNPKCISAKIGDKVNIGECRPLSKSKSFTIFERVE